MGPQAVCRTGPGQRARAEPLGDRQRELSGGLHSGCGVRSVSYSHILVLSLNREDNDELIVIPDGQLDLAELAGADILLELPTSMVCDEGCKGLCPECGANLNEGDCGCRPSAGDPRLAKLRELLGE